jgi:diguanylate cyclase (GGDEF)-like protein
MGGELPKHGDQHDAQPTGPAPDARTTLRGAAHRHRRQLLLAGAIIVLAAFVALSITALRRSADRARLAQIGVANVDATTQSVSRLEWQAVAERGLSPQLRAEFDSLHRRVDGYVDQFRALDSADGRELNVQVHAYLAAVTKQLRLLGAHQISAAEQVDTHEVDRSFELLQSQLDSIDGEEQGNATTAATRTDIGIAATLLVGALGLILALWRLDTLRRVAGRRREQDLEVQALHDALTGLPNRRKLLLDLDSELLSADVGSRCVVVLCDLDGFKTYNDSFGHLEGDLLLARLGEKLARTVAPYGTAYRFGGDEFCALLRVDAQGQESLLGACRAALAESGTGFVVRASLGAVTLPEEAADATAALRLADHRMYAEKNSHDSSAKQQLRDVIMRVHVEQDPDLHDHLNDVAQLAAGVGRVLGLGDLEVADLVRAAEFHDVGKIAIPDSILHKPGPLDDGEQEFMRRHTLIGESILSAASALTTVGKLVRSSHERYDGGGYPDGLCKDEIPLASRIVFVCDAFKAMTTDRPYRQAMSEEDALAELEHFAGTQFDPAVVAAFVVELAALKAASRREPETRPFSLPAVVA